MPGMLDLIRQLLVAPSDGVSDEKVYTEHCAEFRALNTIFWQIPLIVMTLNGGLWFAVASLDLTDGGQRLILAFTALINFAFMCALLRLRVIMESLLERIRKFEGRAKRSDPWAGFILLLFWILMGAAGGGAMVAACNPGAYLQPRSTKAVVVVCERGAPDAPPGPCRALP